MLFLTSNAHRARTHTHTCTHTHTHTHKAKHFRFHSLARLGYASIVFRVWRRSLELEQCGSLCPLGRTVDPGVGHPGSPGGYRGNTISATSTHTHTRTRGGVSTATRAAGRTGLLRSAEPVAFPGAGGGSMTVHGSATVRGPSRAPKPPSAYGVCAFLRRLRLRTAVCCLSVLIVSAGRARAGHTDRHRPCLNAVGRCTTLPAVAGTGMVVPVAGTARLAQESAW